MVWNRWNLLPIHRSWTNPKIEAERKHQFAELLREHHRDLFNFIFSLVHHHADAEDVFQQTTLVLWRKFDDFVIGTNFCGLGDPCRPSNGS